MKKVVSILLIVTFSSLIFAQANIELDFNINQAGSQLVLDSVVIENQTNSTDTIIRWPISSITLDMLSGIDDTYGHTGKLHVKQNYPNPFNNSTIIEVQNPDTYLIVNVYDNQGRQLMTEKYEDEPGFIAFEFSPGVDSQYVVSFSNGVEESTIKMIHKGKEKGICSLKKISLDKQVEFKSLQSESFSYNEGDNLSFTAYTTACFEVETAVQNLNPIADQTVSFDFTHITNLQPETPEHISAIVAETSIDWSWTNINDANGYKYNTENNYDTAFDNGQLTSLNWNDLSAGLNYNLYVWAYNDCGVSFPLHIIEATTTTDFTQDEIDLITSGTSGQDFEVMDICEQPDSVILRSQSINVNIDEEDLILLKDRMKTTVLGEGVGIAAPQIGINRNVIWVQRYDKGSAQIKPWEVYYNPVITAYSDTVVLKTDGCLSVSPACESQYEISPNSYRAIWVDVQYYDVDGNFLQERINHQYTAHIFQHEIDHLNGIMYFDRQVNEMPEQFVVVEGESYGDLPKID